VQFANGLQDVMVAPRRLRGPLGCVALMLASFLWVQAADARLKSEWKFGGSLAHMLVALPGADALDDVASLGAALSPLAAQPAGGTLGDLFSRRGVTGGFAAGFLGAGVLGLLFGHGLFEELSGLPSFLGLMFQLVLIALLMRLIWTWWWIERAPPFAPLSPRQLADAYGRPRREVLPDLDVGLREDAAAGDKGGAPVET
jgi:hypothetical protein